MRTPTDGPGHRGESRSEAGVVLVWAALLITALVGLTGLAVDVAHWYFVGHRAQKAADAAALAGVVHLPADTASAYIKAKDFSRRNKFDDADPKIVVEPTQEPKPTQLRVKVTVTVGNFFGGVFGINNQTIARDAVAEFSGPVPLGSPTNVFGNEPSPDGQWAAVGGNQNFWVNVAGPQVNKQAGDRHQAGQCAGTVDGCSGSTNVEYHSPSGAPNPLYQGYFYNVRVKNPASGQKLAIEIFDPALVVVGDLCTHGPANLAGAQAATGDARYAPGASPYCTGDERVSAPAGCTDSSCIAKTTFTVRAPDNTPWNVTDNAPLSTATCTSGGPNRPNPAHFPGFQGDVASKLGSDPSGFGSYFRKWKRICEISSSQLQSWWSSFGGGTYMDLVLQVRTNDPQNNQTAAGYGHNRFSMRSRLEGPNNAANVAIFAASEMAIYANAPAANAEFYLARVLPGADGQVLNLNFYDIGDAGCTGACDNVTLTIKPPAEKPADYFNGRCQWTPPPSGALTNTGPNCAMTFLSSNGQGQTVNVRINLPNGYTCDATSATGCWLKIKYQFVDDQAVDTTTWSATLEGDPVRLVE